MFGGFGTLPRKGNHGQSSVLGAVQPHQLFRDITPPTLGPVTQDAPPARRGRALALGVLNPSPPPPQPEPIGHLPALLMKPASGIKLSILIPTLTSRASLLVKLRNKLQKQLTALGCAAQVQALTFKGGESYSAGAKKSRLLEEAEGEYVVFLDDDDEVSDDYLPEILRAIREHPGVDCIGMRGSVAANGDKPGKVVYSLSNPTASAIIDVYFRPPCPAMPIRRDIAGRFSFADITGGEDADLALRMARVQAIATEVFIDKVLITQNKYRFDSKWAERSDSRTPASPAPIRRLPPRLHRPRTSSRSVAS